MDLLWRDGSNKLSVRQKCLTGVLRSRITATSRRKKRPNQRPGHTDKGLFNTASRSGWAAWRRRGTPRQIGRLLEFVVLELVQPVQLQIRGEN